MKIAHERNITVKTKNVQNLQSAVLGNQQLASRNIIEIFNKHGREDFTPLTPTPAPTPELKPTIIPSVANNKSEQVNDTKTNDKLPNNSGNGSITATQNTQKTTVATWTFAVAGVVSGVAIAVYLEMLAAGIAVGACCLVAAAVIYYCTPKSSVENSNVETVKAAELTAQ